MYTNRVLEVLKTMQSVQLHALPDADEEPWTVDYFCNKTDDVCRWAATELHRKSLMVEEAVEEILVLVKKARIDCSVDNEQDFFTEGGPQKRNSTNKSVPNFT